MTFRWRIFMKKFLLLLIATFVVSFSFGNVNYVSAKKITNAQKKEEKVKKVKKVKKHKLVKEKNKRSVTKDQGKKKKKKKKKGKKDPAPKTPKKDPSPKKDTAPKVPEKSALEQCCSVAKRRCESPPSNGTFSNCRKSGSTCTFKCSGYDAAPNPTNPGVKQ